MISIVKLHYSSDILFPQVFFVDILETTGKQTEEALQKKYGADHVIFRLCDVTDADQLKCKYKIPCFVVPLRQELFTISRNKIWIVLWPS